MKEFFLKVSPDAWVSSIGTVIGAFLGALTAGIIAIEINRHEKKKDQELYLTMLFPKFYPEIYALNRFVDEKIKKIKDQLDKNPKDGNEIYKELLNLVKTLMNKINKIEDEYDFTELNQHDYFLCVTTILGYKYILAYMHEFADGNGVEIKKVNRIDRINTGLKKNIDRIAEITKNYLHVHRND